MLEVLVSTMNKKSSKLIKDMNIQSDAIIVNQTDTNYYEEFENGEYLIKSVYNNLRGLSRSRNTALMYAQKEYCVLADDDIVYVDGYREIILNAFKDLPDADIIIFNTKMINNERLLKRKDISRVRRAPRYKNYGSVRIAFKRKSIIDNNLFFNIQFGTGSKYNSGEDSLFIRQAVRKGLKIYEFPAQIATVDYNSSTWFTGYNEKYFYNIGAYLEVAYPHSKYILMWYYVLKFKNKINLSSRNIIKIILRGARSLHIEEN